MNENQKITVYFDGKCILCSTEMDHYRKMDKDRLIRFVDISASNFNAKLEGLDPVQANKVIHVKTHEGKVLSKIDAFVEVWKILDRMRLFQLMAANPITRPIMDFGYICFATLRPFLPKRKACGRNHCNLP